MSERRLTLAFLDTDSLRQIFSSLSAHHLLRLWLSGDATLRNRLLTQDIVTSIFNEPELTTPYLSSLVRFICNFPRVRMITCPATSGLYGTLRLDWALKLDVFPKTLRRLHFDFYGSYLTILQCNMVYRGPPSHGQVAIKAFEGDMLPTIRSFLAQQKPVVYSVRELFPQLEVLILRGTFRGANNLGLADDEHVKIAKQIALELPQTLKTLSLDFLDATALLDCMPAFVENLELEYLNWHLLHRKNFNIASQNWTLLSARASVAGARVEPEVIAYNLRNLASLRCESWLDPLEIAAMRNLKTLKMKSFGNSRYLNEKHLLALQTSCPHLETLRLANLENADLILQIPRTLTRFSFRALPPSETRPESVAYGKILMKKFWSNLPPKITSLRLTFQTYFDEQFLSLIPPTLTKLSMENTPLDDALLPILPKQLRRLKLSHFIFSGAFLPPTVTLVDVVALSQSLDNHPKHLMISFQTTYPLSQLVAQKHPNKWNLRFLPPTVTQVDPSISLAQVPVSGLPPALKILPKGYLTSKEMIEALPKSLTQVRVENSLVIPWSFFKHFPDTLRTFRGGQILFDDLESMKEVLQAQKELKSVEVPETFGRHLQHHFSSPDIVPHRLLVHFSPLHFPLLPTEIDTLRLNQFEGQNVDAKSWSMPEHLTSLSLPMEANASCLSALPTSLTKLSIVLKTMSQIDADRMAKLTKLQVLEISANQDKTSKFRDILEKIVEPAGVMQTLTSLTLKLQYVTMEDFERVKEMTELKRLAIQADLAFRHFTVHTQLKWASCLPRALTSLDMPATNINYHCVPGLPETLNSFTIRDGSTEVLSTWRDLYATWAAKQQTTEN